MAEGLVVEKIGKVYQKRRVVKDVNLVVRKAEVVGLLGPNGAGKTTSFYMLMGVVYPDYGKIYLDGKDITYLPMYQRARLGIGYLPQESSVFRGLTVAQNIMAVLEVTEAKEQDREKILEELLAEFSITHLANISAAALSGGERRRVEIARCLAADPRYILLDEPLAGVDPIAVFDIKALIMHLKERGIGILITDHNVKEALTMIDRAYIIYAGSVLAEGDVNSIVNNSEVRKLYLGEKFNY